MVLVVMATLQWAKCGMSFVIAVVALQCHDLSRAGVTNVVHSGSWWPLWTNNVLKMKQVSSRVKNGAVTVLFE